MPSSRPAPGRMSRQAVPTHRSTIASVFPGLSNSNGAVGYFYIDTTTLSNGVHTLAWVVYDNAGRGDGIGSRYFTVFNSGGGGVAAQQASPSTQSTQASAFVGTREF